MSLKSALIKLRETLTVEDLGLLVLGTPELFQNAVTPNFFLSIAGVTAEYSDLLPTDQTTSLAMIHLIFRVSLAQIPANEEWFLWPIGILEQIVKKIETDTAARVYEDDGDKGFEVRVTNWLVEFDTSVGPIATGTLTLHIGGFL